jgi:hypothetical protein
MEFNPCATGGRMRRAIENERKSTGNSELSETGKTKKPYTWSWGKKGVFYYCIHCCLWHEILPIEWRGYPIKIAEYSEDPMAPCYFYFYKDPKLIPDYYFTRVGKKKNPLLFKK